MRSSAGRASRANALLGYPDDARLLIVNADASGCAGRSTMEWIRHADYEFAVSAQARETIEREGIVLLSHEPLREVWAASRRNW